MIKISVDTRQIDGLALRFVQKSSDAEEAMAAIAGIMLDAVEENFEKEGRPEKWTPLAEATVEERRSRTKKGKRRKRKLKKGGEGPILQRRYFLGCGKRN